MNTQITANIENFKSWNGKIYNNAIYVKGEKVTDEKRIAFYQAVANIINEMMNANFAGNDINMAYVVRNKEVFAVAIVSTLGIENDLTGIGYLVAGQICDKLNNNAFRNVSSSVDQMVDFVLNSFTVSE